LDLVVLPNLTRAQGCHTSSQRARALEYVRADLASSQPMLARTAAMVCGELADPLAAPDLCDLLEGADAQLAAVAHGSLKKLSGLGFAAHRERWKQWLQTEVEWYQSVGKYDIRRLRSPSEEVVLEALQSLMQHPLYRDEFVTRVSDVTQRSEPALRR